ncbi:hypothetical protein A2706_01520 [Candidatus Peribacteria bacterium RIFCSPHIGHO2_01_FULL_51_35]|nr:MAG: hypothetical protein A2706_01520 [Candidatus Peribacteria bacterium RIFCSPHIGHO2_01_FULL_51_35]
MYNYEELPAFKAKLAELKGGEVPVTMLNGATEEAVAEEKAPEVTASEPAAVEPMEEKPAS